MSREEMVRVVCETILHEHEEIQKLLAGFQRPPACNCSTCLYARELLKKEA